MISTRSAPGPALPLKRDITLAYALTFVVAVLIAVESAAGILLGSIRLYGVDPATATSVSVSAAGVLVPGFLAHDAFNFLVGLPVLLVTVWLARRGSLVGLLLWPGALFYVLYSYALYLVGAPLNLLFLPYVALVAISAFTTIGLVASIDGDSVRQRLAGAIPPRAIGGLLVVLALMTAGQDATGAVTTALASIVPVDPMAHRVWIVDMAIEVPAVLTGGVLLWRRESLGYLAVAGLLLQYGMTPVGLAAIMVLHAVSTGSPLDPGTPIALLVFAAAAFMPLGLVIRGLASVR
ncbi:MAG TPA: hypothetical protein VF960_14700 [Chloroflexota bacterium]